MKKNTELKKIWDKVISSFAFDKNIDSEIFNEYISKSLFRGLLENTIIIEVSSEIGKTIFYKIKKEIEVKINKFNKNKKQFFVDFLTNSEFIYLKKKLIYKNNKNKKKESEDNLYTNKNFKNFIRGKSNEEAYLASISVAEDHTYNWNPLFIYGSSGLGKTHLLYSIKNKITLDKNKTVLFLNSDDLGRKIVEIIREGHDAIEEYKDNLKNYDILLIDDINFLSFRDKTNEIIFSILNFFIKWKKQIVLTSDCNPAELNGFKSHLISRLSNGLCVKINHPEFETASSIVLKKIKFKKINIELDSKSIDFIATNFRYDVRLIEGVVNRVVFWSIINNKTGLICLKELLEILEPLKSGYNKKVTLRKIIENVSRWYKIGVDKIKSKDRTKSVVNARRVFVYIARKLLNESYKKIGSYLRKDHSTTIFAFKVIEEKVNNDIFLKKQINQIINKINE